MIEKWVVVPSGWDGDDTRSRWAAFSSLDVAQIENRAFLPLLEYLPACGIVCRVAGWKWPLVVTPSSTVPKVP